ncbi:c-type cytochrome [Magnetospirillum sp. 64-120]|uniref:c-type cytochrome n=1 Tax=Magnetospirillum sp. 64-120 TaxID=1895778 RepID=UPI00092CB821|nr:c-type cytochrome [Magnetospirillum sp. 64-120]OJX74331.1 MAG: cystathionine gamma-synthase [Magnetospirillum sp. 64-120]
MRLVRSTLILLGLAASPAWAAETAVVDLTTWKVPDINSLPDDSHGKLVRFGHELTVATFKHIGPEVADKSKRYAGNNLSCQNCHREAATQPYAMPWTGVSAVFPQYRSREDKISTVEDRVNGCMQRSMAGQKLPDDSPEMKAFVAYIDFLSQGIPKGAKITGAGVKAVALPDRMADLAHGEQVFKEVCSACHGEDGHGVRNGAQSDAQGYQFPPLWGPDSYNQGAGMYRLASAARFVMHNMPLGTTYAAPTLSIDQAYDVMAYVNTQPRMAKQGMENDFPNRLKKPADMPFPPYADGFSQAQHQYGPFGPINAELKRLNEQAKTDKR